MDFWCFGVLCFELGNGRVPFSGADDMALYESILRMRPRYPRSLFAGVVGFIAKLLKPTTKRLYEWSEVREDSFFSGVDFAAIHDRSAKSPLQQAAVERRRRIVQKRGDVVEMPLSDSDAQKSDWAPRLPLAKRPCTSSTTTTASGRRSTRGELRHRKPLDQSLLCVSFFSRFGARRRRRVRGLPALPPLLVHCRGRDCDGCPITSNTMILTQCAVCATELGLTLGKKCGRCSTRYCGPECQVQHWKEGGHDKLCKKDKEKRRRRAVQRKYEVRGGSDGRGGGVRGRHQGQTCYICTQALHWKTKEGLVRMCACRGTAGFAHASCLAEQAKILVAEAEENNLDYKVKNERWRRWDECSLCEQQYHGVVKCALGWACWKTYLGRPEADEARVMAMNTAWERFITMHTIRGRVGP